MHVCMRFSMHACLESFTARQTTITSVHVEVNPQCNSAGRHVQYPLQARRTRIRQPRGECTIHATLILSTGAPYALEPGCHIGCNASPTGDCCLLARYCTRSVQTRLLGNRGRGSCQHNFQPSHTQTTNAAYRRRASSLRFGSLYVGLVCTSSPWTPALSLLCCLF